MSETSSNASSSSSSEEEAGPARLYSKNGKRAFNVVVSRSEEELAERVGMIIGSRILENPSLSIGLTVGATPSGTYRQLLRLSKRGTISLGDAHFSVFDEFFAPEGSSGLVSGPHLKELRKTFLDEAHIPLQHLHFPDGQLSPQIALNGFKEVMEVKPLDVLILGIGTDGVIGWNNAKSPKDQGPHCVDISLATSVENHGYTHCVTMGFANVMTAKEVILLAMKRHKSQIIKEIMEDKSGSSPAAWILHNHPHASLFIDVDAAEQLHLEEYVPTNFNGFTIINSPESSINKKIICFSPHPDDTSISAGATLSLLSINNSVVSCVATTGHRAFIPNTQTSEDRIRIREDEATAEAHQIGAITHFLRLPLYDRSSHMTEDDVKLMMEYLEREKPDQLFLPHTGDAHPTHRAVLLTILSALQRLIVKEDAPFTSIDLYMYEGPWSLFSRGAYNTVVSPSLDHFARKLAAIREHKSQTGRTPYDVAADSLSLLRAALVPEQDLAGFGADPPKLSSKVELFFHKLIESPKDVQVLLSWFYDQLPPRAFAK